MRSDDEAWLHTSKGTMSVAAAVRQGLKVNHHGQAVEARSEDVVCHVLIHYCDVVAMAIVLGMLAPAGYETEPRVVNSANKTSAMRLAAFDEVFLMLALVCMLALLAAWRIRQPHQHTHCS